MSNLTNIAVTTAVVGGAVAMAAGTGGASILIGSVIAGLAAGKTHDIVVGSMYDNMEVILKAELASIKKEDAATSAALRHDLTKVTGDKGMIGLASIAVGIGTLLCPLAGLACMGAMIWGATARLRR